MAMPKAWQKVLAQHSIEAGEGIAWQTEVLLFTQTPYGEAQRLQEELFEQLTLGKARHHQMIVTEHAPAYVVGERSPLRLNLGEAQAAERRIAIIENTQDVQETTYYGPGMLNAYLTVSLEDWGGDLDRYIDCIEKLGLATLAEFGVTGEVSEDGRRISVGGKTIATIHTRLRRGIVMGRLSIHTNTETAEFEELTDEQGRCPEVVTLTELGMTVERQEEVRETLLGKYEDVFGSALHIPMRKEHRTTKPPWLRVKIPYGRDTQDVRNVIKGNRLHTVCESAHCPNLGECWAAGTATFMINGNVCTRSCSFCAIYTGRPEDLDADEPRRVGEAAATMNIKFAVVTAVNRDDAPDGGAEQFSRTIKELRSQCPGIRVEVLIPDFLGDEAALKTVCDAAPDVLNHNIETVPRLYRRVRPQARYERSLQLISRAKAQGLVTKSGFMLGLGEEAEEIEQTLRDLHAHGCDTVTIGQYLRPSEKHHPVIRYVTPKEFQHWYDVGMEIGFSNVESGPLVRSSYHAHESYRRSKDGNS